jgi:Xaa-Pro aminopeptidase
MTRMFFIILFLLPGAVTILYAQPANTADDFLSKEFHHGRREALRSLMPPNSVAIIFAAPVRNYANDVDYVYHQNPDFYYFTGYQEPNSLLLVFKDSQQDGGVGFNEVLFVQKRDSTTEQWNGKRLGTEGAKTRLGFQKVYENSAFNRFEIDFTKFSQILFDGLPSDVRDEMSDSADLSDLISQFRAKAGLKKEYHTELLQAYQTVIRYDSLNRKQITSYVGRLLAGSKIAKEDPLLNEYYNATDSSLKNEIVKKMSGLENPPSEYNRMVGSLREIKLPEEMKLLQKAIDISCAGQLEVMKVIQPGMSERQLQGVHEFVHKSHGAENLGYPSIVGAGNNGCILHYIDNNELQAGNRLVLMDVGAEYHGYTADVTRTIPANGKFSPEQLAIYNIVYEAQEAVFKIAKEGTPFKALNDTAKAVIARGLMKLGLIKNEKEVNRYYPHGVSHHLGLDVHDKSNYGTLKKGMVFTVEPGIYINEGSPCDKKWWGIAVRIEDDILVEKDRCELLSGSAPRKASEIEKAIRMRSSLDDYFLQAM